ncbi:DUF2333 family protein [Limnospira sp. Paracas R14]|uniref:DUF2333 family protein n=2 Tax=Limnospira TaxID=2596745 RepID=UPI0028E0CCAF|nr:DUF2333 family protein [Limnospira sp. Paracas R14]
MAGGFALLMATICIYISRMPQIFDVNQVARQAAIDRGHISPDSTRRLPTGYTTVYTVIHLTNWMLDKPGGYLYNDRLFLPRYFIDNMPNFEYGMVVQLRDMVLSLRQEFSRSRAQSVERDDLIRAHGFFSFDHNRWLVPSTESQYRAGVALLEGYLESLTKTGPDAGQFVARQDVLEGWLRQQQRRLGTFGVRLRQNAGVYEFNPMIDTTDDEFADLPGFDFQNQRITPWHQRDDVFYEIRGSVFVLYHTMLAIRTDFEPMLNDFQAMGIMNRILSELHTASQPMISPMVLNGREYGFLHNHSLTMAAHIAKAHLAIQDLRVLLRGGGDL